MNHDDRAAYVERYERRLREHGHSPLALGWGKPGREAVRFDVAADVLERVGAESVLDVGCGFADLHDHLGAVGWSGRYTGIDLVPGLLEIARERHPDLVLELADLADYRRGETGLFDVVCASGIFGARLHGEDNAAHVERSVTRMFELARKAVVVDFLSGFADFVSPEAWHADPGWALALGRRLSKRVQLRHDYMPFEFALTIFRQDDHPGSVFAPLDGTR